MPKSQQIDNEKPNPAAPSKANINTETKAIVKDYSTTNYLCLFTLCFTMALIFANWFDFRLIRILWFNTDAGTLIFPLTFLLSDIITEVYGYKHTRRAIWLGFFFNLIFIIYGQIVIHMPSPDFPTQNNLFDKIMAFDTRIIIASFISYLTAEPFNAYLLAKLKIQMQGKLMGLRFVTSTFIAAGLDSLIFSSIAFYGVIVGMKLVEFILTMWLIKVAIEVIGLPISIWLTKRVKQMDKMDIYDRKTKFTVFSLDAKYSVDDNKY